MKTPAIAWIAALLLWVGAAENARAAYMSFAFTNYLGAPITNSFIVQKVGDTQADGSAIPAGLPIRITPAADGRATNWLATGNYYVTNTLAAPPFNRINFRAPDDSGPTVYFFLQSGVWISGGNFFVTLSFGSNSIPTFGQITNALGYQPLTPQLSTNLTASAIPTNYWSASATLWLSNIAYLSTNGLAGTNYVNTATNSLTPTNLLFSSTNWVYTNLGTRITTTSNALRTDLDAKQFGSTTLSNIASSSAITNLIPGSGMTFTTNAPGNLTLASTAAGTGVAVAPGTLITTSTNGSVVTVNAANQTNNFGNAAYSNAVAFTTPVQATNISANQALIATNALDTALRALAATKQHGSTTLSNIASSGAITNLIPGSGIVITTNAVGNLTLASTASGTGVAVAPGTLVTTSTNGSVVTVNAAIQTNNFGTAAFSNTAAFYQNRNDSNYVSSTIATNIAAAATNNLASAAFSGTNKFIGSFSSAGTNTTLYRLNVFSNVILNASTVIGWDADTISNTGNGIEFRLEAASDFPKIGEVFPGRIGYLGLHGGDASWLSNTPTATSSTYVITGLLTNRVSGANVVGAVPSATNAALATNALSALTSSNIVDGAALSNLVSVQTLTSLLGGATNFYSSTNLIGIRGSGTPGADGTYVYAGIGTFYTNPAGNGFIMTNNGSGWNNINASGQTIQTVSQVYTNIATNMTVVVPGTAPGGVVMFGGYFDARGIQLVGWITSSNLVHPVPAEIAAAGGLTVSNLFPGGNVLVIDSELGNDAAAAASPYTRPWKTAFDIYTTNTWSPRGALSVARTNDWLYFKSGTNAHLVPSLPIATYGANIYVAAGALILRTNFSNTNATGFLTAGRSTVGPLIIPGSHTITMVAEGGTIIDTNVPSSGAIWGVSSHTFAGITNNADNVTNALMTGGGSTYGTFDNIFWQSESGNSATNSYLTIEDIHLGGDTDCGNIVGATITTRRVTAVADGRAGGESRGWRVFCNWFDYGSTFVGIGSGSASTDSQITGATVNSDTNYAAYLDGTTFIVLTNGAGQLSAGPIRPLYYDPNQGAVIKGNWSEITRTNTTPADSIFVFTSMQQETNATMAFTNKIDSIGFTGSGTLNKTWTFNPLTGAFTNGSARLTNDQAGPPARWSMIQLGTTIQFYNTNVGSGPPTNGTWWPTNTGTVAGTTTFHAGITNNRTQILFPNPTNGAALSFTTNWLGALATRTTNTFNQRAGLLLPLAIVDDVTGTPKAKVSIEQNGAGGAFTNNLILAVPGGVSTTFTNWFNCGLINPGAVVTVTDISSGSGASILIDAMGATLNRE